MMEPHELDALLRTLPDNQDAMPAFHQQAVEQPNWLPNQLLRHFAGDDAALRLNAVGVCEGTQRKHAASYLERGL
eukprot:m.44811 g.44811  ORF g.44811 m.44811 type:complete len:75 (+) comp11736_c0_seq2:335-559(+)